MGYRGAGRVGREEGDVVKSRKKRRDEAGMMMRDKGRSRVREGIGLRARLNGLRSREER